MNIHPGIIGAGAHYTPLGVRMSVPTGMNPGTVSGAYRQMISRRLTNTSGAAISNIITRHTGWINDANSHVETLMTTSYTKRISIEYPIGISLYQLTYLGATDIVIPPGATIQTDPLPITIPDGSHCYVHEYVTNEVGGVVQGKIPTGRITSSPSGGYNDRIVVSATATDKTGTMGGETTPVATPNNMATAMFVGGTPSTYVRSFLIVGDSISFGFNENNSYGADIYGGSGPWERWFNKNAGARVASMNCASSGIRASQYATITTGSRPLLAAAMADIGTDVAILLGTNDVPTDTAVNIESYLTTIATYFKNTGRRVYGSTIPPRTGGSWASDTTQSVPSYSGVRLTLNNDIRSGIITQYSGYVDMADSFETSTGNGTTTVRNGTLWKYPSYTTDGVHPQPTANAAFATNATPILTLWA